MLLAAVQAQVPAQIASAADIWTAVGSVATAVAAAAGIIAIFLAIRQLRQNTIALQLQVFESTFKDIRQLDGMWIEQGFEHAMTPQQQQAWCASFFNTAEYLCFLISRKMVRQKELVEFWKVALPVWWKQFNDYVGRGLIRDDATMFTEFKKMCRQFSDAGRL